MMVTSTLIAELEALRAALAAGLARIRFEISSYSLVRPSPGMAESGSEIA